MAKRKKYPKLPNGYGSIKYLGKRRRNPYGVYPPTLDFDDDGIPISQPAICYTDAWMKGFTVLTAYRAGTYYPGYELTLNLDDAGDLDSICKKILSDYQQTRSVDKRTRDSKITFSQVYEKYYEWKYLRDKSREYSPSTLNSTRAAYKNCKALHDINFSELKNEDLQSVLDNCKLKHASQELILSLIHQMYEFAINVLAIVDRDYSTAVKINIPDDDEHGIPFDENEMKTLWSFKDDPVVEFILIMCYSGYRIKAYKSLEINLKERYFKGGIKTAASKNRVVPIHSEIFPLVEKRILRSGGLLNSDAEFRNDMYLKLKELGISKHTPHDCRHTFSTLCEKFNVNENDRKRMLGHAFNDDITNKIYGHRSLEDLRNEIEKIKVCY